MEFESYSDEKLRELIEVANEELAKRMDNKRRESAERLVEAIKDFLENGGIIRAIGDYIDYDGESSRLSSEMSIHSHHFSPDFSKGIITLDFGDIYD